MNNKINSNKVLSSFLWRFAERCGAQGVSFVVSIVLARVLAPDIYGVVALVTVFTNILQSFIDSGFGNALIQKKDADNLDFSTVFYFNIVICLILYVIMFVAAPYIAEFYSQNDLVPVIRIMCLNLIIAGIKNVQQAYVSKNLMFKHFFFATLGGTVGAAIIGIIMAYRGYGVWALVIQQLFNAFVDTLILWITVKWRPVLRFSFYRLKSMFSFGWKLLASSLIDKLYNELRQLVIGKMFSPLDLAYYNRGKQFPDVIVTNINTSIDSVLLPTMSNEQDKPTKVKAMMRRAIKTSTYIMSPLMIGLLFTSETIVKVLLTDKWISSVPFLRIFCVSFTFYPIHTANLNAIKALGRSDLFLKLEIIKKIVGVFLLIISIRFGVMAIAYSLLISSFAGQIINSWPNRKLLNYGYLEQLKDIIPSILVALVMGVLVHFFSLLDIADLIILIIQIIAGIVIYIGLSYLFQLEEFFYLIRIVKKEVKKKL